MNRIAIAAAFFAAILSTASSQTLPLATGEWPPYASASLPGGGSATALVVAAFKHAGLDTSLEFLPWRRAEAYVVSGRAFATFPYQETPDRKGKFLFSAPLFESRFAVVYRAGVPAPTEHQLRRPDFFSGRTIGITAGTDAVGVPLKSVGALVEETRVAEQSLEKLRLGRIDFVIEDRAVVGHMISRIYEGPERNPFAVQDLPWGGAVFRLMVSPSYPGAEELLRRFDAALDALHRPIGP